MQRNPAAVARESYKGYVDNDRAAIENLARASRRCRRSACNGGWRSRSNWPHQTISGTKVTGALSGRKQTPGPVPTLAELRDSSPWIWVHCRQTDCTHYAMAFLPLIIRCGANASSDRLRQAARCTRCGGKGATLIHPSYVDRVVGFQPFPAN